MKIPKSTGIDCNICVKHENLLIRLQHARKRRFHKIINPFYFLLCPITDCDFLTVYGYGWRVMHAYQETGTPSMQLPHLLFVTLICIILIDLWGLNISKLYCYLYFSSVVVTFKLTMKSPVFVLNTKTKQLIRRTTCCWLVCVFS